MKIVKVLLTAWLGLQIFLFGLLFLPIGFLPETIQDGPGQFFAEKINSAEEKIRDLWKRK